jgi:hypothetical protein
MCVCVFPLWVFWLLAWAVRLVFNVSWWVAEALEDDGGVVSINCVDGS